jgi:peptidoglycan/xylan/chitin deacetylase (PgdA/CDA1 family)
VESETLEAAGALVVVLGVAAGVDALELVLLLLLLPQAVTSSASEVISNSADLLTHLGYRCRSLRGRAAAGGANFGGSMSFTDVNARRLERERRRRARARRRRLVAVGSLAGIIVIVVAVAIASAGGGSVTKPPPAARASAGKRTASHHATNPSAPRRATSVSQQQGTGVPGDATVPILMYHVINPPPAGAPFPGLYVPADEFAAQMAALKAAGWHAVTMDQLRANWTRGVPLGPGKPIVISFDNGYESQYTNALPVLQRLGWVGVENIQLTGLPPSEGGLSDSQVRALLQAGWELDTQGMSHADLITLDAAGLQYQIDNARQILRSRYGVPVNWFCYPSGHYDATVIEAVRAAGFAGSTTVVPGWASRSDDPYALPRLRVLGGTSPSALLEQIASDESAAAPPASYGSA